MGDPRKHRKKYSTPGHPWQKERIDAEKELLKQYGLRRKYEIWKVDSFLRKFLNRAKTIIRERTLQSDIEKKQLLTRLSSLGLLKKDSKVEDVLNLNLKDVLERRLQTLLCRKQIAKNMLQARQFITHEHVAVGTKKITTPSYLVSIEEEPNIRLVHAIKMPENTDVKKEEAKPEVKEEAAKSQVKKEKTGAKPEVKKEEAK
ncbi:30S ribosomal protein S4 [Candidatus Woesearchaeota archaeon]|jgi:small subunit ribosomal protein S4|nr:30S ribosomal protein S4 [Candidatus Woesearchaeota archaeon]MDP6648151.1 30S ribosomal protein S4 [Candidatus Woesearchaeota archaeon]|tara:strand:+ start:100753 stop:101358 length:606 start_codon:yes stop_codon:yes gene_type:complete